ncbi:MAG: hypothetical protein Q7S27_05585 [Nanoarchaeota archaeon]|nr:hypothetical protein [Nanoarchaeota archaeon]
MKKTLMGLLFCGLPLNGCSDTRADLMNKNQPVYKVERSLERDNINKRLKLSNDPNQLMWVYCLGMNGDVVISSPVLGKVSSSSKRLEPSSVDADSPINSTIGDVRYSTNELMSADGTYGGSDPYVYWFTPEGQYFQWNGQYIVSNVPLRVEKQVFNVEKIDYDEINKARNAEAVLKSGGKINNKLEIK